MDGYNVSIHARKRMDQRSINQRIVETVLNYGRSAYTRGACIYAVGKKEVKKLMRHGIDLRDCQGVHVVCEESTIVTVYRNNDLRGLRA